MSSNENSHLVEKNLDPYDSPGLVDRGSSLVPKAEVVFGNDCGELDMAEPGCGDVNVAMTCKTKKEHAYGRGTKRHRRPRKVVYYYDSASSSSDVENDDDAILGRARSKSKRAIAGREPCREEMRVQLDEDADDGALCSPVSDDAEHVIVIKKQICTVREKISVSNPRIGSPTPIGFFAFGMTTLLYNIHTAKICKLNQATMGLVIFYGGLTQFVCGWFELINMNTFGCTISTTYGAFWMATAVIYLWPSNEYVDSMGGPAYTGGFFILWCIFASTLFASAFRAPIMTISLVAIVPLNFLLQAIANFTQSNVVARVSGYEGIVVGALATYLGMAFTMKDAYGKNILPLFEHENFHNIRW